jgi:hypothetical protein
VLKCPNEEERAAFIFRLAEFVWVGAEVMWRKNFLSFMKADEPYLGHKFL